MNIFFNRGADVIIYGEEFVNKMDAFCEFLDILDIKCEKSSKHYDISTDKIIKHLKIGYTIPSLEFKDDYLNNEIVSEVINAYMKHFPNSPIHHSS